MAKLRVQIITRRAGDLPIDHIVNTLFLDVFGLQGDPDYQKIADDARNLFVGRVSLGGGYGVECKVYDMADVLPRPIRATAAWVAHADTTSAMMPREVALCLSFYAGRNIPRYRGRLFIGPFQAQYAGGERPQVVRNHNATLAAGIAALGGSNVDWQLYSPTRVAYSKVTNWWVDDEWDTIRSRGLRATSRLSGATGE
jgi:hypothetical protein